MFKKCNSCQETFPIEMFPKNSAKCKSCKKIYMQLWISAHREEILISQRKYQKENKEEIRAKRKKYNLEKGYQINREWRKRNWNSCLEKRRKRYSINPEFYRSYSNAYRRNHPLSNSEWCTRQKAKKIGVKVDKVNRSQILERDGWICGICGKTVSPEELSFDHIIPLSKGGPHTADNLQVAHKCCNSIKFNRIGFTLKGNKHE